MALARRHPAIIVSCSGGARMMEGALSLMQMAKVSAALARLDRAQLAVHLGAHRSDHRWCHGQLRDARRSQHRRTQGADRLRRPARHRTDDQADASRGLPAKRVPAGAWHARPRGRSPRPQDLDRPCATLHACHPRAVTASRPRHLPASAVNRRRLTDHRAKVKGDLDLLNTTFDRLFALETFGIKLGLDNISLLCEALGHPERAFRSLHVAGTNGKGSVTAMTHAALRAAGIRAARYTSPHLSDLAERFVIDDRPADPNAARVDGRGRPALRRPAASIGRPLRTSDVLRGDDGGGLRALPPFGSGGRRHRGRARAAASTPPM